MMIPLLILKAYIIHIQLTLFAFNDYTSKVVFTTRLLYSKFTDAVNQKCVDSMLPKWESRLGGADQFTSTHCFTMSEALRVDPTVAAIAQNSTSANN